MKYMDFFRKGKGVSVIAIAAALVLSLAWAGTAIKAQMAEVPGQEPVVEMEASPRFVSETYRITAVRKPENLNFAGEPVPVEDPDVLEKVDREFLVNTYWQSNALLLIKRARLYFPIIEPILARNGIPDDFKYLAVAESGLDNLAASPAGARGSWQLLKGTAREYGLEVNDYVDERYHLEKATQAACEYLKKWKEDFGTWTLAAAAYNAGPSGVRKYMDIQGAESYYDLLLGEETGRYVFRILAIKEILSNYRDYGFDIPESEWYTSVPTYEVKVDSTVNSFAGFAREFGLSYKVLKRYNQWLREPELKNPEGKTYYIRIPRDGYHRMPVSLKSSEE